jgi:hypothetical protein
MPLVPIDVPPGVVKKATPLQSAGRYWDANLVRWQAGKLLPVGGWSRIKADPFPTIPTTIFSWNTNAGTTLSLIGCEGGLYALQGSIYTDVTPVGFQAPQFSGDGGYGAYDFGSLLYGDDTDATYPRPAPTQVFLVFSWAIDNWGGDALAVASSDGRLLRFEEGAVKAFAVGTLDIVTAERSSNIITLTTENNVGFTAGDSIDVSGVSDASMNGTFTIVDVLSQTTFTYADAGPNATGSGGSVTSTIPVPANNRGVVVTPERHAVLFGSGGNSRRVAWSSQEDYTDWDFASATTTSGYLDLDTTDAIIMAASVREGTLIWTNNEAWLMRYVGLPYVYSIERIGFGCGLLSPKSFATTAGRCIWMGREGFWLYDGGVVKPLPCDVGAYVFSDVDPESGPVYSHGSDNGVFSEVWFWYPEIGSSTPDRYVVYNYSEAWWSIGGMERSAASPAGVYRFPLTTDSEGNMYFQEDGWDAAGTPITTERFAETASINIQGGNSVTNVMQAITDSGAGYDSTQMTVYGAFTPSGVETEFGPYSPRPDGYTDMRAVGRDFRIKIESTKDAEWSIGQTRLDIMQGGRR